MTTNFRVKIGEIGLFTFIGIGLTFRKGLQYRHSDCLKVHVIWLHRVKI